MEPEPHFEEVLQPEEIGLIPPLIKEFKFINEIKKENQNEDLNKFILKNIIDKGFLNAENNNKKINDFIERKRLLKKDRIAGEPGRIMLEGFDQAALAPALPTPLMPPPLPIGDRIGELELVDGELTAKQLIAQLAGTTQYLAGWQAILPRDHDVKGRLVQVLDEAPQANEAGDLIYLLCSGLSVELITGYNRFHKDVDLVLLHPDVAKHPILRTTDNVDSQRFWADMRFDPKFLVGTSVETFVPGRGILKRMLPVRSVSPAITMVQKISDAWGRAPREHDILDAKALAYHIIGMPEQQRNQMISIGNVAVSSLRPREAHTTAGRLNALFAKYEAIRLAMGRRDIEPAIKDLARAA